jgi:UDP-3-O-[3-hydroxymyristoyl] N-acetylglucosamine deacetylase
MTEQQTLTKTASLTGIGVHSGVESSVTLKPAPVGAGLTFVRVDVAQHGQIPLHPAAVGATTLQTVVTNTHGVQVETVEHLLSALVGLGVDNCLIEIDGPEVPILDGSAAPWVALLDEAGRQGQGVPPDALRVDARVVVAEQGARLVAEPADDDTLILDVTVDFPVIGRQQVTYKLDEHTYRTDIAPARTFAQLQDVEKMRQAGLIRGGSLACAVVFNEAGHVVNEGGLRFPDEPVRHKILDALGDFALANRRLYGRFSLEKPGHALNNRLLQALTG